MTTGELISVRPNLLAWLPQLFVVNERVALTGNYRNKNFLSVVAVGATNVGSVRVYHDEVKHLFEISLLETEIYKIVYCLTFDYVFSFLSHTEQ